MQTYKKYITVQENDLDQLRHVNNVKFVQWIQDVAEEHWLNNATDTILDHYFWVLLSHHIEYKSEALLGDELMLKTYISNNSGVKSTRQVEIINNITKKLVVSSETIWCLMSSTTKRPSRITDEIVSLFE